MFSKMGKNEKKKAKAKTDKATRKLIRDVTDLRFRDAPRGERMRRVENGFRIAGETMAGLGSLARAVRGPTSGFAMDAVPLPQVPGGQVAAPAANGYITRNSYNGLKKTRIRHRELLGDVAFNGTAGEFGLTLSMPINVGNPDMFPWLSLIACRYEMYRIHHLCFTYEPSVATTSAGSIYTAVDYNVQDLEPLDQVELMAFEGAVKSPVWFPNQFVASGSSLNQSKAYYVAYGTAGLPENADPKTYFPGQLYSAVTGTTTGTLGELYVDYDVELLTPTLEDVGLQASISPGVSWDTIAAGDPPLGNPPIIKGTLALIVAENVQTNTGVTSADIRINFTCPGRYLCVMTGVQVLTGVAETVFWTPDAGNALNALPSCVQSGPDISYTPRTIAALPIVSDDLVSSVAFIATIAKADSGFYFSSSGVQNDFFFGFMADNWDTKVDPEPSGNVSLVASSMSALLRKLHCQIDPPHRKPLISPIRAFNRSNVNAAIKRSEAKEKAKEEKDQPKGKLPPVSGQVVAPTPCYRNSRIPKI